MKESKSLTQPSPRGVVVVTKLDTIERVRRAMVKVYWEARRGQLDVKEANGLVFILQNIARTLETAEMERKVTEIEAKLGY